jgi:hypothetical protein
VIADQVGTILDPVTDFLAFGMGNTKRDALKWVSRAAMKVVAKWADTLSQITSINSGDPGDLAGTGAGRSPFGTRISIFGCTIVKHSAPRSAVDVLTGLRDA